MINFVQELKSLNDLGELKLPKATHEEIETNAREYASKFIETEVLRAVPLFKKAYDLGKKFGKELNKNAEQS